MPPAPYEEFALDLQEPATRRSQFCGLRDFIDLTDEYLSASRLGWMFHLSGSGHVSHLGWVSKMRLPNVCSRMKYKERRFCVRSVRD